MINLTDFRLRHTDKTELGHFSENDLLSIQGKIPNDVISFLRQEGKALYGDAFFRTVLPNEFHSILSDWGLEGSECYAFLLSSFGSIIYTYRSDYFALNPCNGRLLEYADDFDLLMNGYLQMPLALKGGFWHNIYIAKKQGLPTLKEDEIYAFNPTIPEGGSPETSKLEVVKFKNHLHKLAELHDHTTTE
jgi:hypothetical protein